MTITIAHFITTSGQIFANCMFIFHKKEVQTVILKCLMSQNTNWFKRYDTKCTLRLHKALAKLEIHHQNLHLIKDHFTTISGLFCVNYTINIYWKVIGIVQVFYQSIGKSFSLYREMLHPILGIPLASKGKLPSISKLPIEA